MDPNQMPEMYPPNETPRRPAGPLNPPTEPVRPGLLSPGELETGSGPLVGASPLHEARWPKVNQFSPGGTMQTVLLTSNPPGGHQPSSTGSPPPEMTPPSPTALPLEGLPVSPELVEIAGLAGAIGRTREIRTHYVVLQRKVTLIESLIPRRCEHWQIEVELPQVPAVGCWIEVPWVRRDAATKPYRFYIDGQNNRIILSSGEYDARVELSTEMGLRTWDSQKWGEQHKQSGWRLTRVDLSSSPPYESRRADYATAEAAMRDGWYVVPYNGQLWQWRHPVVPMTVVYDPQHLSHSPYDLPLGLHVQCVPKTVVDLPVMTEGVDFTAADVASANPMRPLTAPAQAHDRIRPVFTAPAGQVLVEVKRPQILDAAPQPADLTEDERTRQAAAMNAVEAALPQHLAFEDLVTFVDTYRGSINKETAVYLIDADPDADFDNTGVQPVSIKHEAGDPRDPGDFGIVYIAAKDLGGPRLSPEDIALRDYAEARLRRLQTRP